MKLGGFLKVVMPLLTGSGPNTEVTENKRVNPLQPVLELHRSISEISLVLHNQA
jgi:hypothetical protein